MYALRSAIFCLACACLCCLLRPRMILYDSDFTMTPEIHESEAYESEIPEDHDSEAAVAVPAPAPSPHMRVGYIGSNGWVIRRRRPLIRDA